MSQGTPCSSQLIWCETRIEKLEMQLEDECEIHHGNEQALQQQLHEEHEAHLIAEQRWIEEMAEAQAREKVLRDALNYCADNVPEFWTVPGVKDALNQPTDDTALQDLILKERTRAIESWKAIHLKAALAAEREHCAHVCDGLHDGWKWAEDDDESGPRECAIAIRALGEK